MTSYLTVLADIGLLLHFAYVLFVVLGQVVILVGWIKSWEWTRNLALRIAHLLCIGIVVIQAWLGVMSPLTVLEAELRLKAGAEKGMYETTFIGHWVAKALFYEAPLWAFTLCYSLFGLLVALTLFLHPPRRQSSGKSEP